MAEAVLVRGLGQRADVYFGKPAHSAGSACWRGGGKRHAAGSTTRGRDAQAPGDTGDEHRGQGSEGAHLPDDDVDGCARLHGGGARDLVGGRARAPVGGRVCEAAMRGSATARCQIPPVAARGFVTAAAARAPTGRASVTSEKSINKKIINRHRNYDEVCIDSVPSITDLLNHSCMPTTPSSNKKRHLEMEVGMTLTENEKRAFFINTDSSGVKATEEATNTE
ncbi:unnamed protein product [Miscanthus lutarioriparius]|uniref:Uncharacterized protein n=1 Tax=Miscanthus lutarioriparius TaxID=422564 RepID=A0A811N6D9_9POAL|nr:unnamed protein product [Miscanthus lutarioriparius]